MKYILIIIGIVFFNTGCAFVVNGGKQDVSITVQPHEADISANGRFVGTGSATTSVDRNSSTNITVTAPGYDDGHLYLQKKMNAGWAFWDIATCVFPITLCIPVLVDGISGAWNGYDDHYAVKLLKSSERPPPQASPAAPIPPALQPPPINQSGQQIIIIK